MKGQVNIVFTYIFILVVIALILIFGMRIVNKSKDFGDEAILINFYKNLDSRINSFYYLDVGSIDEVEFKLPNKVEHVCFIDDNFNGRNFNELNVDLDPELVFNIRDNQGVKSNVFISPSNVYENNRFRVERLGLEAVTSRCIRTIGGNLRVNLETKSREFPGGEVELYVDVFEEL